MAAMKVDTSDLDSGLEGMMERVDAAVLMYASTKAKQIQADAQKNRPWADRTGRAKAGLVAEATKPRENLIQITLAHGVRYGIWLELAKEKKYAIIGPTLKKFENEVMDGLNGLLNKIRG